MPITLPDVETCYFCEMIRSHDRWNIVEETLLTFTMVNGRQYETGQCMVIPARHAPTLLDLTVEEEAAVMAAARRAAHALVKAFNPDGVLLYQTNGVGAGQEVPHFHLHVVPRTPGSDWGLGPPHMHHMGAVSPKLEQSEGGSRPAHIDHTIVTDAKRQTAELIRRYYQG